MASRILEVDATQGVNIMKALGSESRIQILRLLSESPMNIQELGRALGLSQPAVTRHVQDLVDAGLINTEYKAGVQGMQKECSLRYTRVIVTFGTAEKVDDQIEEVQMPLGLYTLVNATPPSGLLDIKRPIGKLDDPQAFFHPDRFSAQLLYMSGGFVEYIFPCTLPPTVEITRLDLSMEVCSEAPHHNLEYPSDITVWINNVEIGTWTSPADFGGKRGRLTPSWWDDSHSQYGVLKIWTVDDEGAYVDGTPVSNVNLKQLLVAPQQPITIRVGVKPDAEHQGGINLFGRGFGNYEQDLILRLHYANARRPRRGAATVGQEAAVEAESVPGASGKIGAR